VILTTEALETNLNHVWTSTYLLPAYPPWTQYLVRE
jgi:hypothetical protein